MVGSGKHARAGVRLSWLDVPTSATQAFPIGFLSSIECNNAIGACGCHQDLSGKVHPARALASKTVDPCALWHRAGMSPRLSEACPCAGHRDLDQSIGYIMPAEAHPTQYAFEVAMPPGRPGIGKAGGT